MKLSFPKYHFSYTCMLFSILIIGSVQTFSQQNVLNFKRISPDLGLSHQHVTSFYQDSIGYIWMTNHGGVDRFDGYTFQSLDLNLPEGVNPDGYTCIYKDANGLMWIGTRNEGIIVLDQENNFLKQYKNSADDDSSLATFGLALMAAASIFIIRKRIHLPDIKISQMILPR